LNEGSFWLELISKTRRVTDLISKGWLAAELNKVYVDFLTKRWCMTPMNAN